MVIILLAFAVTLGVIAIVGAKASKAARKAKMRQDLAIYHELQSERKN